MHRLVQQSECIPTLDGTCRKPSQTLYTDPVTSEAVRSDKESGSTILQRYLGKHLAADLDQIPAALMNELGIQQLGAEHLIKVLSNASERGELRDLGAAWLARVLARIYHLLPSNNKAAHALLSELKSVKCLPVGAEYVAIADGPIFMASDASSKTKSRVPKEISGALAVFYHELRIVDSVIFSAEVVLAPSLVILLKKAGVKDMTNNIVDFVVETHILPCYEDSDAIQAKAAENDEILIAYLAFVSAYLKQDRPETMVTRLRAAAVLPTVLYFDGKKGKAITAAGVYRTPKERHQLGFRQAAPRKLGADEHGKAVHLSHELSRIIPNACQVLPHDTIQQYIQFAFCIPVNQQYTACQQYAPCISVLRACVFATCALCSAANMTSSC